MTHFFKDPAAVLDYTWDWTDVLVDGDTVASAVVTGTGVTITGSAVIGGTKVVARVAGGTIGIDGSATCAATFASGQVDKRTIYMVVVNR